MKDEQHKKMETDFKNFQALYEKPTIAEAFRYGWEKRLRRNRGPKRTVIPKGGLDHLKYNTSKDKNGKFRS